MESNQPLAQFTNANFGLTISSDRFGYGLIAFDAMIAVAWVLR